MCACIPHTCLVPEELSTGCGDPLELELQRVVSHHRTAGNPTRVLCKRIKYSQLLSHLSSPIFF